VITEIHKTGNKLVHILIHVPLDQLYYTCLHVKELTRLY